jgi:hypothetical protein
MQDGCGGSGETSDACFAHALTAIIGARRAWTVSMSSASAMPCS